MIRKSRRRAMEIIIETEGHGREGSLPPGLFIWRNLRTATNTERREHGE